MLDFNMTETVKNMRNRTARLDRGGDYWTEDEKQQLAERFDAGEGITSIAIQLQRSETAIFQQCEKMDLFKRKSYAKKKYEKCLEQDGCLCSNCEHYEKCQNRSNCDLSIKEGC